MTRNGQTNMIFYLPQEIFVPIVLMHSKIRNLFEVNYDKVKTTTNSSLCLSFFLQSGGKLAG